MVISSQNKTNAEHLLERILQADKEQGNYKMLKQKSKMNTSIEILYQPRSKRPEEHIFQYFT